MKIEIGRAYSAYDKKTGDYLISQIAMAKLIGLPTRDKIRTMIDAGTVKQSGTKILLAASLQSIRSSDQGIGGSLADGTSAGLDLAIKVEDLRKRRRENDLADGQLAHRDTFVSYLQSWSKDFVTQCDMIEGKLAATMPERPKCREPTTITSAGREKIRETVIAILNTLHVLHRKSTGEKNT